MSLSWTDDERWRRALSEAGAARSGRAEPLQLHGAIAKPRPPRTSSRVAKCGSSRLNGRRLDNRVRLFLDWACETFESDVALLLDDAGLTMGERNADGNIAGLAASFDDVFRRVIALRDRPAQFSIGLSLGDGARLEVLRLDGFGGPFSLGLVVAQPLPQCDVALLAGEFERMLK